MKRNLLLAALPVVSLLSLAAAQDQNAREAAPRGLIRVDPGVAVAPRATDEAATFDAVRWRERLGAADHDERMRAYDKLVRRGWQDDAVGAFLQEILDDAEADSELRWTARLALRELDRVHKIGKPLALFAGPEGFFGGAPLDVFFGPSQTAPPTPSFPLAAPVPGQALQNSRATQMSVEQTEQGWKIKITENVDGDETVREYEGESLEAIIEENPELEDELNVMPFDLGGGMRLELHGAPGRDLAELFERELGDFRGFRPLHPFEWQGKDGEKRRMRFLIQPQRQSQPVRTDVLGVRVGILSEEQAREFGLEAGEGLFVASVLPGTIAHVVGMRAGAVLLEVNGEALRDGDAVTDALLNRSPRDGIEVVWIDALGKRHERTWLPERARNQDELEDF